MNTREIFEAAGLIETPDSVSITSAMAGDNAAETVKEIHGKDGKHSDEFLDAWSLSVSSVLSSARDYFSEEEAKEAQDWFEVRGIYY